MTKVEQTEAKAYEAAAGAYRAGELVAETSYVATDQTRDTRTDANANCWLHRQAAMICREAAEAYIAAAKAHDTAAEAHI